MAESTQQVHVFGVRHHGPGCARSLLHALEELRPNLILVEGPPDADELIGLAAHEEMKPPVAILVYTPDEPKRAVFYPFAEFSPEWQALRFAVRANIPAYFMDLPQCHQLAKQPEPAEKAADEQPSASTEQETAPEPHPPHSAPVRTDPIARLASAAGYDDPEAWWDFMIEERVEGREIFAAIQNAMATLRQHDDAKPEDADEREVQREAQREAWMRSVIRKHVKDGHETIAVVCGAWHVPALVEMPPVKDDAAVLKGLPKVKVKATWTPWTFGRLTQASGYGAGVASPGWYEHLYSARGAARGSDIAIGWLTRVARLLRDEGLDVSSAHVIEAVRTAEALAAIGDRSFAGLSELQDAARAVIAMGEDTPMSLIHSRLMIGERLGQVPDEASDVPIAKDLESEQKRLRLQRSAVEKDLDLDLRKENDRDRSYLLHRLMLLSIPWGQLRDTGKSARGTFHEIWRLQWQPEFAVSIIEAAIWGNTVEQAATYCVCDRAAKATDLPTLAKLLSGVLLGALSDAVELIVGHIETRSAVAGDTNELMDALPHLAGVIRYGDVRKTDVETVERLFEPFLARICIGLAPACQSLDRDAAQAMFARIVETDRSIALLQHEGYTNQWHRAIGLLASDEGVNGLILGRCCRILMEAGAVNAEETERRMRLAMSPAVDPTHAADWLDGFLRGSGSVLIYDDGLLALCDTWLTELSHDVFMNMLPLVRRTFSTFSSAERHEIGRRLKAGRDGKRVPQSETAYRVNVERADRVLPVVMKLLGIADASGK